MYLFFTSLWYTITITEQKLRYQSLLVASVNGFTLSQIHKII